MGEWTLEDCINAAWCSAKQPLFEETLDRKPRRELVLLRRKAAALDWLEKELRAMREADDDIYVELEHFGKMILDCPCEETLLEAIEAAMEEQEHDS